MTSLMQSRETVYIVRLTRKPDSHQAFFDREERIPYKLHLNKKGDDIIPFCFTTDNIYRIHFFRPLVCVPPLKFALRIVSRSSGFTIFRYVAATCLLTL